MRRAAVVLFALVLSAGCGYSLAGRGSALPGYIQTIGVPLFSNSTAYFEVEQVLTERVRSELIGRGNYRVLPEDDGVDALLSVEITSVSIQPASFDGQQQASRYIITLEARIEFRDLQADSTIWESRRMVFRDEYEVAAGVDAPTAFFGTRSNAVERVATDFARTVVSAMLEAF